MIQLSEALVITVLCCVHLAAIIDLKGLFMILALVNNRGKSLSLTKQIMIV